MAMFRLISGLRRGILNWFGVKSPPVVAIVRMEGVIDSRKGFRSGLNLASLGDRFQAAFGTPGLSAVVLEINSPGGSPVQSALIFERIRELARKKDVPVLAFCEDVAASGGYILALAGDEIYAHQASIVGSIGVVSGGFGFPKLMEKIGVDRRLYTAGDKKVTLDMFGEETEDGVARLKAIQADLHNWFKNMVRKRRGKRLKGDEKDLFSGDVFLGEDAAEKGLIDDCESMIPFLEQRFGEDVVLKRFGDKKSRLSGILGVLGDGGDNEAGYSSGGSIGTGFADRVISVVEERSIWSRFGL